MSEPWVVTYRAITRRYDQRSGWLDCSTMLEAYRGSEAECRRIADHLVLPDKLDGHRVLRSHTIIGPAADWDNFLREFDEAGR